MRKICFFFIFAFLSFSACGIPEDSQPSAVDSPIGVQTVTSSELIVNADVREELIYLFDEGNLLSPVFREIPSVDLRVTDLINELIADLSESERNASLSTAVPVGLTLAGVIQEGDVATINFNAGGLEVIEGDELAKALAQIIFTLTETGTLDAIIISIEGDVKTWPTPNGGDQQFLRRIQFMSYAPEVGIGITQ
ncbi:MAG: GerMN domain-containing protein [Actinomycetota bacterium]